MSNATGDRLTGHMSFKVRKVAEIKEQPVDLEAHAKKIEELQKQFRETGVVSLPSRELSQK